MEEMQVTVDDVQFFAHVMMGLNVVTVFTAYLLMMEPVYC